MITDTIEFFAEHPYFFIFTFTLLSSFVGSFLNVLIYRFPIMLKTAWEQDCREFLELPIAEKRPTLNLLTPLSHCPHCKHPIRPWHNIPIISYFLLRGRCKDCKTAISFRYPGIEILTTLLSGLLAVHYGFHISLLPAALFTWILIGLSFIDIDHLILPDELTLSLLWLGLFSSLFHWFTIPTSAILGAMAGYLIFATVQTVFGLITGKVGMGMGDFKLLAALGAFLGWQQLPFIILLSSLLGIFGTLIIMALKRQFKSEPFPFGPYLAIAGWIALLYGPAISQSYFTLLLN